MPVWTMRDIARSGVRRKTAGDQDRRIVEQSRGFFHSNGGEKTQILGGGPAGVLYGVGQWLSRPKAAATAGVEKPDFELRGTALFLMKDGSYDYQLTPQEFPWFYDRPLLTNTSIAFRPTASTRFFFGAATCFRASCRCPNIRMPPI